MNSNGFAFHRIAPICLCAGLVILLCAGSLWFYTQGGKIYRQQMDSMLIAIAQSKADHIHAWRREWLTDGALLMTRRSLIDTVARYLEDRSGDSEYEIRRTFREFLKYKWINGVFLVAPDGSVLLSSSAADLELHHHDREAIAAAIQLKYPVFSDLHLADRTNIPMLSITVPLYSQLAAADGLLGAVVMSVDLENTLFSLIAGWPVPSDSAETLLIRKEGDEVIFLNKLRHSQEPRLSLRISDENKNIPAVMAARGATGIVQGHDYRGVEVLAAIVPIADSPWIVIAKIDELEAFAHWRWRAVALVVLLLAVAGVIVLIFMAVRQQTRKNHFRELYLAESRLRTSIEKHAVTLNCIGDAVIATDPAGRVELMNPVAERITGWSAREAIGRPLDEIFQIIDGRSRSPLAGPVAMVMSAGGACTLAVDALLRERNGAEVPIAERSTPIYGQDGEVLGVVVAFRDQAGERQSRRLLESRVALISYAAGHGLDDLLTRTLDTVSELVSSPIGFYHFLAEDQKTLVLQQWSTRTLQEFCQASGKGLHYNIDQAGVWVDCVRQRKPVIHNDYNGLHHKKGLPPGHAPVIRQLVVPVIRENRIVAIMGVGNKPDPYTEGDVQLVEYMADVTWDIVSQKRMAEQLARSERTLTTLLGNLPGMAYHCRNDEHWTLEFVSKGCSTLTGYQPEELLHNAVTSYAELIHPDDRQRVYDEVNAAVHAKTPFVLTYRIQPKGGGLKWVWEQGRAADANGGADGGLEGLILDITKRKMAETERERLLLAVEQTAESIVITDADGAIQYVNPAFSTITGFSRAEVIGQNPRILKSGKTEQRVYQEMWRTISSGQTWHGQLVNRRKDGRLIDEDVTISPVVDRSGKISNYVAVKRDISEQLRLTQQMQQAQKMEAVGHLAGGVAHDYNNMLAVIIGFTDLALAKVAEDDPLRSDLQEVLDAANRSAEITRQLLAFARKQTIAPRILDCNQAIGDMIKMLRRLIGENIRLSWQPGEQLWLVRLDPAQLNQILANLCVNARDAMVAGGSIVIETGNVILDEQYCATHMGVTPGEYVRIAVSDDGEGMGKETLERVFEPFFTTKEVGQGTGLGLATVFGIVKQNKGYITVYSEPGHGSTFRIYLPRQDADPQSENRLDQPGGMLGNGEHILVVEDEKVILSVARRILEELNYRVSTARSGAEALAVAENASIIDLLLTDVIMPEMNGRELAKRLRERFPKLKCLYMSGYTADAIARHGVLESGVNFLEKPFTREQLGLKVRSSLLSNSGCV